MAVFNTKALGQAVTTMTKQDEYLSRLKQMKARFDDVHRETDGGSPTTYEMLKGLVSICSWDTAEFANYVCVSADIRSFIEQLVRSATERLDRIEEDIQKQVVEAQFVRNTLNK